MTMKFYTQEILPHHIEHIKELEKHYKHQFWFQEDNDGSHRTRSNDNIARRLKNRSRLLLLLHPAQSPDLNPIEAIWNIIKQRLRGGSWQSVQEFKDAIFREWKRITLAEIRKRISEMRKRCDKLIKLEGRRIKSNLW
jgi:hypothetical protein